MLYNVRTVAYYDNISTVVILAKALVRMTLDQIVFSAIIQSAFLNQMAMSISPTRSI